MPEGCDPGIKETKWWALEPEWDRYKWDHPESFKKDKIQGLVEEKKKDPRAKAEFDFHEARVAEEQARREQARREAEAASTSVDGCV